MAANERFNKLRHEEPCSFLQQEEIGLWSLLFFDWMTETFKTGTLRPLQQSDLLPIEKQNRTKVLTEKFQQLWNDEQNACVKSGKQPRLWKCVVKMLRGEEILIIAIFSMVHKIGSTLRCLLLGFILSDLISNNGDKTMTYTCAVLLGVVSMGERFASHSQRWMSEVFGARICCALKGIVYSKITRVGLRALQEFEEGHVIDLLSNDITLMEMAPEWIFDMISLIYLVLVVLYLFVNLFRWEALLGLLFLVGLFPYFLCGSHLVGNLRRKTAGLSDRRISRISELMSGIRTVKTQALEQYFARRINKIRKQELKKIRQKYLVVSAIEGMVCSSSSLAVFLSSLLLVLGNWELTPVNAFMLLSFMNVLRTTFSVYLKQGLLIVFEASVSLRRIEEFLLLDDLLLLRDNFFASKILPQSDFTRTIEGQTNISSWQEEKQPTKFNSSSIEKEQVTPSKVVEDALFVSSLTYKMTERDNQHVLCDVSFVTPTQSLTIICGRVGSGKSTLLSAIAGEVKLSNGTVKYPGTLAYVPQVPWVFSGTIRENILFGESDDPHWYSTVVEACALKEDIELFPNKDDTLVGQRGVVLSGGQKARVSLARAVYSCADVYVLDDPLSAVDQKVGDEIFSRCICGLLGDKIRVLVSHHRRYLQEADEIIVMEKGRVLEKRRPQLGEAKYTATIFCNTSVNEFRAEPDFFTSKTSANKPKGLEILDEDRASGNVSFQLYWDYFTSGVHPLLIFTLVALFVFTQPAIIFPDIWLSILSRKTLEQQQKVDNIVIYAGVTAAALVFTTIRVFLFFIVSLKSSQRLHGRMVQAILHARLSFFDTNPPGRILNRFSRDITSMDEQLPQKFILCIQDMLFVISAVLIPAISNPWLLLIFFPTIVAFLLLGRYYLKTSRELKRLESICRSPVYSHFTETMAGLDTIRTRRMQKKFVEEFYRHQDLHNQAIYMVFGSTRWFGLRVDLLCVPFLTCVALGSVAFSMDPAIAGLSLSYVMETLDVVQYAIRQFSEVENIMTSVERVITYTKLESEPGYKTKTLPFTYWPRDGQVTLRNVTLAYYEHGPQVLKNLNFSIHGNSRVGVIGRTGAGKSSLVAAFLRMPDAQGDVIIDGVKINDINLKESRRSISVLSQVPVLFCGSLRQNLDPMNQYEDVTLWAALEDVQLKSFVESLNGQLEYELQEGATNLSAGERQLVCLARTLLQHNRIVILDEPTAHVDPITEQTLWKAVHEKLNNCTVITIAHRLDTIKTCDTILVMREGEIAEFGTFDSLMGKGGYVSWLKNYR